MFVSKHDTLTLSWIHRQINRKAQSRNYQDEEFLYIESILYHGHPLEYQYMKFILSYLDSSVTEAQWD